jgi:AsmA protein
MRKLKIVAGIVVALIVIAVVGVWLFLDVNKYRPQIQARLEEQLQRKVTLGNMSLGLLPLRFTVQNVVIAEDPAFKSEFPFTHAKQLDVRVSLLPLLSGNVKVNSVDLDEPSVELIRNDQGVWNFSSLAKGAPTSAPAPKPKEPAPTSKPTAFSLNRLSIRHGKIAVTDLLKRQPRTVYEPIDVSLRDYAPGKPFSFDVTAHIPGDGAQEIAVKGTGGPLPDSGPAAMPLKAALTLSNIDIAGLRKFLDSQYLSNASGTLGGETQIESQAGKLAAKGNLNLKAVKVGGVDIGYPVDLSYDLSSEVAAGIVQVTNATLKLGETPISVTGTLNTNPTPIEVDLRLKSGEVSIAEVARLASAFGIAFAPDTTVVGKVITDVQARGPIDKLALNGNVSGRDLQISGKNLAQPVSIKELNLALTPTTIQSNEFQATTGKTTVVGRIGLRDYTSKRPSIDAAIRAPGASLPEIQNIARAYGVKGLDQLSGAGALSFDLRAAGPLDAVASTNVTRALNGNVKLGFEQMKYQGVDASRELARIGGFLNSSTADKGYTDIIKLAGNVIVKNGVAQTSDLQASLAEGTLALAGTSDLATEALDLRAMAMFSKAFSDKVGGTKVGGYLTTALSNSKGEIVIPAIITGTFKQPKFAPDQQAFLKLQKERLLDDPAGALGGILDAISGKKKPAEPEPGSTTTQEKPKTDPLQDALRGLFGGGKK